MSTYGNTRWTDRDRKLTSITSSENYDVHAAVHASSLTLSEPDVDNNGVGHEYITWHVDYCGRPAPGPAQRPGCHHENVVAGLSHPPHEASGDHSASRDERPGAPRHRPHPLSNCASG